MQSKRLARVPRVLCSELPSLQRPVLLSEEEANHLHQVLRLKNGGAVIALNGRGQAISAEYSLRDKKPFIQISAPTPIESRSPDQELTPATLELAVIKGDSMSWVIEKAVELGVRKIVPVLSDYAVIQTEKKGLEHFLERWQRIADQALKQCERLHRLSIDPPSTLDELFRQSLPQGSKRLVAIEPKARTDDGHSIVRMSSTLFDQTSEVRCMIGPEGGWSNRELQLFQSERSQGRLQSVDLGNLVLRAETAALFTMSCALSSRLQN